VFGWTSGRALLKTAYIEAKQRTAATANAKQARTGAAVSAGGRPARRRGRLAHEEARCELDVRGLARSPLEKSDEDVDPSPSHLAERLTNRRERRRDECRGLDVVEPYDGEIFRDAQPAIARGA
jgi:hypothetical protein